MRNIVSALSYWMLPRGLYDILSNYQASDTLVGGKNALLSASRNLYYKDIHKGKRCFILCNGPSVSRQNLIPLKNEIVFSVSSGYLHKDYDVIRPRYHCSPQLTYTDVFTKDVALKYFKEMEEKTHDAELFLSYSEEALIRENRLFKDRKINILYFSFEKQFDQNKTKLFDLTKTVPAVQSVPIMCLIIAMYMGFKKIYLLGVDHDILFTGRYEYAFQPTVLSGKDKSVNENGIRNYSLYDMFHSYCSLWGQYRALKNIASSNGILIYNATDGGALDEFERVNLHSIFEGSKEKVNY